MKAMILAAGLGTRLRPLTNDRPKALVEVAGKPLLEHAITKLTQQGTRDIIINTHHFAEKIAEFLESKKNFGVHIELSHEPTLLDTGGGLNKAAHFFNDGEPFLLYNTDVLSNIDLGAMLAVHQRTGALATLAVRDRKTSRYFLFDDDGRLVGWTSCCKKSKKLSCRKLKRIIGFPLWAFISFHLAFSNFSPNLAHSLLSMSTLDWLDLGNAFRHFALISTNGSIWEDGSSLSEQMIFYKK